MTQYRIVWEALSGYIGNGDWTEFTTQFMIDAWVDKSNLNTWIVNTWVEYK